MPFMPDKRYEPFIGAYEGGRLFAIDFVERKLQCVQRLERTLPPVCVKYAQRLLHHNG